MGPVTQWAVAFTVVVAGRCAFGGTTAAGVVTGVCGAAVGAVSRVRMVSPIVPDSRISGLMSRGVATARKDATMPTETATIAMIEAAATNPGRPRR